MDTFSQLMALKNRLFPNGDIGSDNTGQLIIYTGLKEDHNTGRLYSAEDPPPTMPQSETDDFTKKPGLSS